MASLTLDQLKARQKALSKIGVKSNIKVTKNISSAEKNKLNRLFNEFKEIANANKGDFKRVSVKDLSATEKKYLKNSGYKLSGEKAFIPMQGLGKAEIIRRTYIEDKNKPFWEREKMLLVRKSDKDVDRSYDQIIDSKIRKMYWRDRILQDYANMPKDKKKVQYLSMKIGPYQWLRTFGSIDKLLNYVANDFKPDPKRRGQYTVDELRDQMELVMINVKDGDAGLHAIAHGDKNEKQKSHDRYTRNKNRKKTASKLMGEVKRK